jgi:hypothetical protein
MMKSKMINKFRTTVFGLTLLCCSICGNIEAAAPKPIVEKAEVIAETPESDTILITIYGGPEGFDAECKAKPKERAVSTRSFDGIIGLIKKNWTGRFKLEIRDGLPDESDAAKNYAKRIHIQPGGNFHRQYSRIERVDSTHIGTIVENTL